MADNSRPVAEPLQKGAQAAQAVRGAVKTGKAIAGAAKGAAAGGVWGAVAGFAWENRKFVGKVIIAATAVLMIPILILCMLPGIIFGGFGNSHSPADPDTPIMNSSAVIDSNLTEISTAGPGPGGPVRLPVLLQIRRTPGSGGDAAPGHQLLFLPAGGVPDRRVPGPGPGGKKAPAVFHRRAAVSQAAVRPADGPSVPA